MIGLGAETRHDLLRWALSAALVLIVHGAAAALMVRWTDLVEPSEPSGAIVVELAPVPVAPALIPDEIPPGPQQVKAEAAPEQPVEQIEEKVERVAEVKPQEQVEEKIAPVPVTKVETKPVEKVEPTVEAKVEAKPDEKVETKPTEIPAEQVPVIPEAEVVLPPPPPPPPPPKPAKQRPVKRTVKRPPAPVTSAPRAPHTRTAALPAAPVQAQPNRTNSNAIPTWISRVVAQIERHKGEKSGSGSGTATVSFTINRSGRLLSARVLRSSGSSALDSQGLAIVRRSSPFPPPPPEKPGAVIALTVPIRFR